MTEQQEKPNLEVLWSEFVAELKRPLDPQVLSLFSRCGDQICRQSPPLVQHPTLTSGAHNNCAYYALACLRMGVGIGILPELEEIFVSSEKSFERTLCNFAQY